MPWLSIIMALISFFVTKKKTNGNTAAALGAAALVGGATYYATHETDWGKENLGFLDGVTDSSGATVAAGTGNVPSSSTGTVTVPSAGTSTSTGGFWDGVTGVLKDWGPTGTALVVGTAGAVTSNGKSWIWWAALGVGAFLLLK